MPEPVCTPARIVLTSNAELSALEGELSRNPRPGDRFAFTAADSGGNFEDFCGVAWYARDRESAEESATPECAPGVKSIRISLKSARMYFQGLQSGSIPGPAEWPKESETEDLSSLKLPE